MVIVNDQNADQSDFINESEKDATPANDAGRVPKNEADGRLAPFFTRNGTVLNCGETLNGATTPVPVYQNKTDNELYACDANDTGKLKFIGFVTSDGSNGNPARFQGVGVVAGFSGLSEGEKYYVQDTAGTIGTTPGTQEILVGIAISETELLIQKGRRFACGTGNFPNNSTHVDVDLGFRPSVIRMAVANGSTNGVTSSGSGVWVNGTLVAASSAKTDSNEAWSTQLTVWGDGSMDDTMTITITNVTDTGFRIVITETGGSYTEAGNYIWEAEGEL